MRTPRQLEKAEFIDLENICYPKVEEQAVYAHGPLNAIHSRIPIRDQKALINPDSNQVYDIVSKGYKLVRHEEVLESALDAIMAVEPRVKVQVCFPEGGARMWAKIHLVDRVYKVGAEQGIIPTIEIFGSYDKSWATKAIFGAFRLVCTNGLVIGMQFAGVRTPHLSLFSQGELVDMVRDSHGIFISQTEIWREWQTLMVTPDQYERIIEGLNLTHGQLKSLENEVEISSRMMIEDHKYRTLSTWDFFNCITQNLSHDRAMVRNRTRQAQTFNNLRKLM